MSRLTMGRNHTTNQNKYILLPILTTTMGNNKNKSV